MKFTCPQCAAPYDVPDRAIKPAGQIVRCAKCGQRWNFVPPAVSVAVKTPPDIMEHPAADSAAVFENILAQVERQDTPVPVEVASDTQLRPRELVVPKADPAQLRRKKYQAVPSLAGQPAVRFAALEKSAKISVAVLAIALVAFCLFGRAYIAQRLPFTMGIYNAIGLPAFPLGSGLSFVGVTDTSDFEGATNQLVIKGEIQNTTPYRLAVPLINLKITAPNGQSKNFLTRPPVAQIAGGQSAPYLTLLRRGFAKKGWKVMLSFGGEGEKFVPANAGETK